MTCLSAVYINNRIRQREYAKATPSTIAQKVRADSMLGYSGGHNADISDIPPVDRVVNTGMAQKRCLCGQVANVDAASQMPGWKVRREVSIQCNLLPLLPPTIN
ncbi:hypothetical protein MTO96_031013, partial [Rhipicephalus appendiculatus]